MKSLLGMFSGVKVSDWEFIESEINNLTLQKSALDIVIGKIVSSCSLVTFRSSKESLNYLLNVSPNHNENAIQFRSKMIRRLLEDGEVLIINQDGMLYVADSWVVNDTVLSDKVYSQISIGALKLNKTFLASQVCHIKYHNEKFKVYLKRLDESYGKLFSRVVDTHMRDNQLRVYAKFKGVSAKDANGNSNEEKFKTFLKGLTKQLRSESVVVSPHQDDYDITESSQNFLGRSHTEVGVVENMYIRQVAMMLQVPPILFNADFADISQHNRNFVLDCIKPLMTLVTNALNKLFFNMAEYVEHDQLYFNMIDVIYTSEFEMAKDVEKMVGSAVWTIDDVLILQGKSPEKTKLTTQRYLTKNIAPLGTDEN